MNPIPAVVALAVILGAAPCGHGADTDTNLAQTTQALFASVRAETLPNGLRVYLLPVPGAATVTVKTAYRVGSADEEPGQTGLSHYLEHLLFKGTDKFLPGDIDRLTQRNGGRNNAYTSEDMTVYHFDFAADRWETALIIEADRMRNTRIDPKHEFEQEKGAVIAERNGGEDQPWDREYKVILPLLFPKDSPYGHPVIGEEDHVRGATAEIIKRHYDKWYHPNNAALVIVGGFDPDRAMARITQLFGPIPRVELAPRFPAPGQKPRTTPIRKQFPSKFDVPRLVLGFNTVTAGHPDDYVFDLLQMLLTDGKTSRLYRRLVEEERLANAVGAANNVGRYPGWFEIKVELLKGKDQERAERLVFAELERLAREPVSAAELQRIRRGIVASFLFSRENMHNLADAIAQAVTRNDLDYLKTYLDRVLAITPADLQRVAREYLTQPRSVVVWSIPEHNTQLIPSESGHPRTPNTRYARANPVTGGPVSPLTQARRLVLPNGLTLLLLENHRLPIVVAEAQVADVRLREPAKLSGVAALMGEMLEEGTTRRTGAAIANLIENAGGQLVFDAHGGTVKVLKPDTNIGLELLLDGLMRPSFPASALERKREQLLSDIADVETQPQNRARNHFQALVYGSHPFGRSRLGSRAIVQQLTAQDLRSYHKQTFAPDTTTVAVVGDFDTNAIVRHIERLPGEWKPLRTRKPTPPAPQSAAQPREIILTDPTAAQTHVYIGHIGITRNNPDYYRLLVLDHILGTGPGFTDRLSATLRDRQGLAYTVTAQITATAADQPGLFLGYIGTFPDKYRWVREGFLKEIRRIRDEEPTRQEVEDAKQYLLGSLPFRFDTNQQIASQLLAAERYGLGFDMVEKLRAGVSAVTPTAVQTVAKKYLHPQQLVIVAVGPIDASGKPLPKSGQ
ncbi:MAG: insulinase family protein [Bacteroidales bacterium]|nr:insulinase family protein [Bacteroidales bacterium]